MSLDAGRLNRRITLQAPTRAPNGSGGSVKGWSAGSKIWGELIPLRGGEALEHSVLRGRQLWKVTIRHRDDVAIGWRILFGDRELNIRTCEDPDGTREALVITAESGTAT